MKNKVLTGALILFVAGIIISCNTEKAESGLSAAEIEQIKQEIQAKENQFADTYNAGEKKQIGYYADDAISYSQNKEPLVGREAIVEYLFSSLDSLENNNKISFTTNEVFVSCNGDQVLEIGYYQVLDSDSIPVNTGNYMSLFVKRDGKYVCLRDMSASDIPL
jgi:ketosteroid isomerase-like protein